MIAARSACSPLAALPCVWGVVLVLMLLSCGTRDRGLSTDEVNNLLSITNLSKLPIRNTDDPPLIVALAIDVDVINVGITTVRDPVRMTWSVVGADGESLGSASRVFVDGFGIGERRSVSINVTLTPVASLDGTRDVVIFDLVK